jgi:hypothetical protein
LVSADKGYTPLNLNDNIISDIVEPNIPDTIANIKQKSLHGRYFKELEQPEINIQASHAWLKKSNILPETEGFIFTIQQRQAYLLDIAVPNSHNITQTYNTKINKYLDLSIAIRNLVCLEKFSI